MENGAYHCYLNPDHKGELMQSTVGYIRDRGIPANLRRQVFKKSSVPAKKTAPLYELTKVEEARHRLLHPSSEAEKKALDWVLGRGYSREMIKHFNIGYGKTSVIDEQKVKQWMSGVAIFIPTGQTDQKEQFYRKLRVEPWLTPEQQPSHYRKWSQAGIPSHIWLTYNPPESKLTLMCEGEWDAIALGWLAKQEESDFTVACATTGAGTVPPPAQLQRMPGDVITFYDRNDVPSKSTGERPGDKGALRLALALEGRGRIGEVPCSEASLSKQGWDVSDAINEGHTIADFQVAAYLARFPEEVQQLQAIHQQATEATAFREAIEESVQQIPPSLDMISAAEDIGQSSIEKAVQQEAIAWKGVRSLSSEVYQDDCPEPTKDVVAGDIGEAMRTLYQILSVHSPELAFFLPTPMENSLPNPTLQTIQAWFKVCQAMSTPSDQLKPIHEVNQLMAEGKGLPPGTLDDIRRDWNLYQQNLSSLIKSAYYILKKRGKVETGSGDQVYIGKTYELRQSTSGTLTLAHHERGTLLEITPSDVIACNFKPEDVHLFSLQAQRIEQSLQKEIPIAPFNHSVQQNLIQD
jgi:hypothetical protein